jgi:uncharacterized protein YecA (UPF0149 family)
MDASFYGESAAALSILTGTMLNHTTQEGPVEGEKKSVLVKRVRTANPPAAARNAPCPCGSGKKYKRCCRIG